MRPKIPWGRLSAEGSVIVVSILLALAVQAWWEGLQERRDEVEHLTALRAELVQALGLVPSARANLVSTLHSHEALIAQFLADPLAPPDSLVYWLSDVARPATFFPPRAVLDDLVSSGGVQAIRTDSVRLAVAEYQGALVLHRETRDQSWAIWADRIQPYLEGKVSRVDRLRLGSYATPSRPVPFAASPFAPDYTGLFTDRIFESMLAERWVRLNETSRGLDQVEASALKLVTLIERNLGTT